MDDALRWQPSFNLRAAADAPQQPAPGATARTGGDGDDEPVLIGVVNGIVEAAMAEDALREEGIPAFVKRSSLGALYGVSIGGLGRAEVWVPQPLAERARDVLIGMGLIAED